MNSSGDKLFPEVSVGGVILYNLIFLNRSSNSDFRRFHSIKQNPVQKNSSISPSTFSFWLLPIDSLLNILGYEFLERI